MEKPHDQSSTPEFVPPMVLESEIKIEMVRSSGPGGQNVNKKSSKAKLKWNVGKADGFSDEQKQAIRDYVGEKRLTKEDDVILDDQSERSPEQNKANVVARLQRLVAEALTPQKERVPTRVSRNQKAKRLDEKKLDSRKKESRRDRGDW